MENDQSGMNFVFSFENSPYSIDPQNYGNFARLINHSCDPNLVKKKVFINHDDVRFPRVAFFTLRTISVGEELSIDYGYEVQDTPRGCLNCFCGSDICRQILT